MYPEGMSSTKGSPAKNNSQIEKDRKTQEKMWRWSERKPSRYTD